MNPLAENIVNFVDPVAKVGTEFQGEFSFLSDKSQREKRQIECKTRDERISLLEGNVLFLRQTGGGSMLANEIARALLAISYAVPLY